ncbi:hypothetical protein AXF42_Ash001988 [Apostasia shenzhenica]|uniref:Uncharacterized protein n=1 Tax=Apostasia shenzhenica TaxID=1088818 RepID=A0A2I0ABU0_9ASPA|nr:hypothetical protein AXF42_Ash001988 [Apostasia shenzhenica]
MVVRKEWGGGFLAMEANRKGRVIADAGRWFTEELPGWRCCPAAAAAAAARWWRSWGWWWEG